MSIPKLKFLALFFVFFAFFWQITTSFYIKMLSTGRQEFSSAAGGAAGLPRKESLRLFQPQAEGNAFRGTLCQAAPHVAKKHKGLRQNFAWRCTNSRRKIARRLCFALPRCVRVKKTEGRSVARRYALRPLALAKWQQHLPRGFCAVAIWRGHLLPLRRTSAPLLPVGVAPFEQCARGEAGTFEQLRAKVRACNKASAFAVLFADAATIQTIRLLRRLRVLSVRRGNVIMIRARVFIYISMLF